MEGKGKKRRKELIRQGEGKIRRQNQQNEKQSKEDNEMKKEKIWRKRWKEKVRKEEGKERKQRRGGAVKKMGKVKGR
jgi:hypothetical protein